MRFFLVMIGLIMVLLSPARGKEFKVGRFERMIHSILRENDDTEFNEYLKKGDFSQRDELGDTLLETCIRYGEFDLVKELVESGASVQGMENMSAAFACGGEVTDRMVRYLVEQGALKGESGEKIRKRIIYKTLQPGILYDTFEYLIKQGAEYNNKFYFKAENEADGYPLLTIFIKNKRLLRIDIMPFLMEHGADINEATAFTRTTPLMYACKYGEFDIVKLLVEKGVPLNQKNIYGETALDFALNHQYGWIFYRSPAIIIYLLEHGADPASLTEDYNFFLYKTVGSFYKKEKRQYCIPVIEDKFEPQVPEEPAMLKYIAEHKEQFIQEDMYGKTVFSALILLYANDFIKKHYIDDKFLIHYKNRFGQTPLMFAARYKNTEIVKLLLERHADVNAADENGWTPLMCAEDDSEIKTILVQAGAVMTKEQQYITDGFRFAKNYDWKGFEEIYKKYPAILSAKDFNGESVLLKMNFLIDNESGFSFGWSAEKNQENQLKKEFLNNLLKLPVNLNIQDRDGKTALHKSLPGMFHKDLYYQEYLLENGADIFLQDKKGNSPFVYICHWGDETLIEKYLKCNPEIVNQKNKAGRTILNDFKYVVYIGSIAPLLLKYGADSNTQDIYGRTPLMNSVLTNHCSDELCDILLKHGADVSIQDNFGRTVFDYARPELVGDDVVKLLESYRT